MRNNFTKEDMQYIESMYSIERDGKIYSHIKHRYLKQHTRLDGRKTISVRMQDGKVKAIRAHRLVATKYIPNPNNLPQVDHIDRNPSNNNVDNLRWVTEQENHNNKAPTTSASRKIRCKETGKIYESVTLAAQDLPGDKHANISNIVKILNKKRNGKWLRKTVRGFSYELMETM